MTAVQPRRFWTVALILSAGLALLQFGAQSILWFLPYHLAGFLNEIGLLVVGLAIGFIATRLLARLRNHCGPGWRAGLSVGLLLYATASFSMLGFSPQTGLGFGAYRYTVFSSANCEFAARFPGPANRGRLRGDVFERVADHQPAAAAVAVYADLPSLTALRADCLPIANDGLDSTELAATAARQWAARIGIEIAGERLDRVEGGAVFRLRGSLQGSVLPADAGGSGRTLAAIDSHIGSRSIMTVYVFQPDDGALSPLAIAFLQGVKRR